MPFLSVQPKIIIAGAGIGGLTTALALHATGFTNINLYESASHLTTLGVGINVQPSAVLILRNLGLLDALEKTAIQTKELNFYNRHGDAILSEPRGVSAGYTVPQFSIHRGEFQMVLLSAVKERLGEECIHLDAALVGFTDLEQSIMAQFSSRHSTIVQEVEGDILIAADGINSTARRILYPKEGPPRFSGRILWRGCLERPPYLTGASMVWAGHADQKFIAYPISQRSAEKGKSLVNWIAELRVRSNEELQQDTTPPKTDWTKTVDKSLFKGPFESWRCGGLEMKDLIESTDQVFEFPMSDRDPVDRWSFGRLTLLGDAAHAMYPIGSNGASQAIIDAETLAKHLSQSPTDPVSALQKYQDDRLPPTTKIVMANRANGPDHVLQLAEERAPDGFTNIYDVIPQAELEDVGRVYKAVAGFEREAVNEKAQKTTGIAERNNLKSPAEWI
ncbi:FAD/NAD(P)-binding domain-containing protein [Aaosphaeria arxii CBS 175.79]|uniref:FAD/NAD(P)-binding domain-containing protein n=1 Tax=Aaosphaeria arxii CBS 175.79 TaxID=1450172 RepID=A0A6A5XVY3_9PLEO|nr:FAD/NAD(P)-binding domain-containing protein [Aaosphaeria arxii CBS 175.79]KAF2016790.1 FAD/NAD(P)-binding domain-containing protein [Aaosphaeria arxii CBS 175.79]